MSDYKTRFENLVKEHMEFREMTIPKYKIREKIKELRKEIGEFEKSKEPKCYQDEIDRLWAKIIVLEEILEED